MEEFVGNVLGILALILPVVLVLILLCRIFGCNKIPLIMGSREDYSLYSPKKTDVLSVGIQALLFRLLIYYIAFLLLKLTYMSGGSYLEWWTKWDATNYIGIASGGYDEITTDGVVNMGNGVLQTLVFLPLYPTLVAGINYIIQNVYISALVVSTICFTIGIMALYLAIANRYGKSIAEKTVILISVSPFAFYFGGMLPESTFLMVTALCMYFTIKRRWWLAGLMGVLCGTARLQGVIIIVFMGIEWFEDKQIVEHIKNKDWKKFGEAFKVFPALLLPFMGTVIYLIVNYAYTKDFTYFMKLQSNVWAHSFTDMYHAMKCMWSSLLEYEFEIRLSVWIPQILIYFITIILMFVGLKRHKNSMIAYLLVYLIISYSTDFLASGGRYMSAAIPFFVLLGELCERKPVCYRWSVAMGLLLQVILMGCHVSGWHMVT